MILNEKSGVIITIMGAKKRKTGVKCGDANSEKSLIWIPDVLCIISVIW